MFRLTRVIVRLCSEPFGFSTIVTVLEVVGRYEVVAILTNYLMFIITQVPHATHTQVHLRLLLIIHACGTCTVAQHNILEVYALFTRTLNY
jgi:hypothetical protein